MSGLVTFLALVAMIGAWAWAWRQVATAARSYGVRAWVSHVIAALVSWLAALGGMVVVMALVDTTISAGNAVFMGFLGVLILSPFAHVHWQNRKTKTISTTLIAPSQPIANPKRRSNFVNTSGDGAKEHKPTTGFLALKWEEQRIKDGGSADLQTRPSVSDTRVMRVQKRAPQRTAKYASVRPAPASVEAHGTNVNMVAFGYVDADGVITNRRVLVKGRSQSGGRKYIEGICLDRHVARSFRLDRIMGSISCESDGRRMTPTALFANLRSVEKIMVNSPSGNARTWETAVFFAGFGATKRAELEDMAEVAGWQVRSRISETVDYVVAGAMVGRAQLSSAEALGITVIDEDSFRALM